MDSPAPQPARKKQVWVKIFDDEETERRLQALEVDECTRDAIRKMRELWQKVRYSEPVEVPPPGEYFYPPKEVDDDGNPLPQEPPQVEQIVDRVVVSQDEPKITRTRRRSAAVRRPRKLLPWVTQDDLKLPAEEESHKPGPQPLLDAAAMDRACMCLTVGLSRGITALELGVSPSTLSRAIKRDPAFKQRVLLAEGAYEKNRILQLLQSARESWRAGAWMFKHYHPHLSIRRLNRKANTKFATEAVEKLSEALRQDAG